MKWAVWVAKLNTKKIILLVFIIMALSGGLAWYFGHKNSGVTNGPSTLQLITNGHVQEADRQIAQKNYQQAEQYYITAATAAISDQGPSQAISILQQAAAKFPAQYADWQLYDNLAGIATLKGDKTLETQSLQKALAKAQLSNSGAPADTITKYKQLLSQLGAKQ